MRLEETIEIDAAPGRAWEVMSDIENWPEWTASVTSVAKLDPGPLAPGTRARIRQPRVMAMTWRVTEVTPGASFTWEARSGGVRSVAWHRVAPNGSGGSSVTLGLAQSGPLASLVALLFGRTMQRYVAMEAAGLKRRCEEPVVVRAG